MEVFPDVSLVLWIIFPAMASGILGLATEIIYEICNHVFCFLVYCLFWPLNAISLQLGDKKQSSSELCRFRAVCKHLNGIVEDKLFSCITVDVAPVHGANISATQLESLVSGSCRAANFAKTLQIRSLSPMRKSMQTQDVRFDKETEVAMVQVRKNLRGAITSLKNVTNISLVFPFHHFMYYLPSS